VFYIEKKRVDRKKDILHLHFLPTLIILLSFITLTLWIYRESLNRSNLTKSNLLQKNMDETAVTIQNRLAVYENMLRSSAGFVSASEAVTREEWKQFVDVFDVFSRYPGVQGIGYVPIIKPESLDSHISTVQSSGISNYTITPSGARDVYTSILYLEPLNTRNSRVIGYDMYSDPLRRKAMDYARDSAQTSLTDVTVLMEDEGNEIPGFVMFLPVYSQTPTPPSVSERRSAITAYVYSPFRAIDLFSQTFANIDTDFAFEIYDEKISNEDLIYKSKLSDQVSTWGDIEDSVKTITVNNQDWLLVGKLSPRALSYTERNRPVNTLIGGFMFSFLIAAFLYLLLQSRTQALARKESREIQNAKDELLALASHQLRTPATGVKQYIGILREGYAGELTEEQKMYVDKAYASNERQLTTINEMLFVARADTGHLDLSMEHFNMTKHLKEILEEHADIMHSKNQLLIEKIPQKSVFIYGDPRYIRMALENIVSNATKYTPENGTVTVGLRSDMMTVRITVTDTGVGVSKKDMPLLFEKFSRIPNELTNKVTGSGIGLYLARKILIGHKGTITFVSREGVGSRCEIKLPLKGPKSKKKLV
jgi:signal transduction histidine kinase